MKKFITNHIFFVLLLGLVCLSTYMRMSAVNFKHLQMDEFYHFATAESVLQGQNGELMRDEHNIPYIRAIPITLLTILSAGITGSYDPWVILPVALISSLTIVALYLYLRSYSKLAGVNAGIIWVFAPLILSMGSYAREYSLFLFVNITWVYYLEKNISSKIGTNYRNLKLDKSLKYLLYIPIIYSFIDFRSTFSNIYSIYLGIFSALIFYKRPDLSLTKRIIKILLVLFIPFSIIGVLGNLVGIQDMTIIPKISKNFTNYFLTGSHTFANSIDPDLKTPIMIVFLFLVLSGLVITFKSKLFKLNLIAFIAIANFVLYGLYYNRYFEERYYIYPVIWTTLLIAIALEYYLNLIIKNVFRVKQLLVVNSFKIVYLVVIFFLFSNFYLISAKSIKENSVIQKDFHTQKLKDYSILDNLPIELDNQTAVITPNEHIVLWYFGRNEKFKQYMRFDENKMFYFDSTLGKVQDNLIRVVKGFPKGYFIMDKYWLTNDLREMKPIAGKNLCNIYEDDVFIVLGWGRSCNDSINQQQ